MMPSWEAMYVGEIRAVTRLWWTTLWALNNIAFCTHIRRVAFAFVGIIWTRAVHTRFSAIGNDGAGSIVKIKARDMHLVAPTKVAGALLPRRCMFTRSVFAAVAHQVSTLWTHISWFALARVRALLTCSSNGAAINARSCVRGTLSFWSPVSLTFADVRTMGTSSVWTSYATLADRFTVQT